MTAFIFAHNDDEVFFYPYLRVLKNQGREVRVFFMTKHTDPTRKQESINALKTAGIKPESIHFIGDTEGLLDGNLENQLDNAFEALVRSVDWKSVNEICTHDWEGGHPDHDCCFVLALKLATKYQSQLCGFAAYNGYNVNPPFYRVQKVIPAKNKKLNTIKFSVIEGLKNLSLVRYYPSQTKTFIGLGPFIFWNWIIQRKIEYSVYQNLEFPISSPHDGALLRTRRYAVGPELSYEKFKQFLGNP